MKRLKLVGAFLRGRPLYCSWQLTRRCASLCHFCEHRFEGAEAELDAAGCETVARSLRSLGSLVLSLSGGEPFLHPELEKVVSWTSPDHFVQLTTHGWLVSGDRSRGVWKAGLRSASVTLHAGEASAHDARAGVPGAFDKAVAAADTLLSTRSSDQQTVRFKLVLDPAAGLGAVERALALSERLGLSLALDLPHPLPASAGPLVAGLLALKKQHRSLRTGRAWIEGVDAALAGGVPGCPAGRAIVNVDHRGRISKCVELQGPAHEAGSLLEGPASELSSRLRERTKGHECTACWHGFRGEIQGLYTARGALEALPELLES